MNPPPSLAYVVRPDENYCQVHRKEVEEEPPVNISVAPLSEKKAGVERKMEVTRLSARALKRFNKEHGEPLPFGGQGNI